MPFVIRSVDPRAPGQYLAAYDLDWRPDGEAAYPCGTADWTDDPDLALRFETAAEATAVWRAQSTRVPFRPDGRANRPLTAFTVEIDRAPEEAPDARG